MIRIKSKILSLVALLAAIILPSCNESWNPETGGEGTVLLSKMGVDVDLAAADKVVETRAADDVTDVSDYIVTIINSKGVTRAEWTYSQMPEVFTLPVGTYTVEVASHRVQKAEWNAPLYKGSTTFQIEDGKVTEISDIICKFANIKVSINFDKSITPYLGDDIKVTVVANDEASLTFEKGEKRFGCFQAIDGNTTLVFNLSGTVDGYYETKTDIVTGIVAGNHVKINYKRKNPVPDVPDETGSVEPGIGVDSNVETDDVYNEVPVSDDPIDDTDRPTDGPDDGGEEPSKPDKPDPTPGECLIKITGDFPIDEVNTPEDGTSYVVYLATECETGFEHIYVKIDSETLPPEELATIHLKDEFDLAYPEEDLIEGFKSLKFQYGDQVIGSKEVEFNITEFVPLLNILGTGESKFILTAVDASGSKEQTIIFKVD
ncbi:MAG: DUF4493 domain-containing protein [Barnesiella sp.]|nr:DUF4493 domain-containing protein [Bacteroidales bacterium]MBD5245303.1 DUF4493 domain-containing protein [Barnesiella sp.]MBD5249020.1 DUF4493 domain-containing protein [Barnesiella sp.]